VSDIVRPRRFLDLDEADALPLPTDILVPVPDPRSEMLDDGSRITWNADDSIDIEFDAGPEDMLPADLGDPDEHAANLAAFLAPRERRRIAEDILELIEIDKQSCEPWRKLLAEGMRKLGVVRDPDGGAFPGAASVVYTLIGEGAVQFNARALGELFPAAGPVKAKVVGEETAKLREQAQRVEDHLNYQLTVEDKGYFHDVDQLLFELPVMGSGFKHGYIDPIRGQVRSRYVKPTELIVPYAATSLEDATRYTLWQRMHRNDVRKLQVAGWWLDVRLDLPSDEPRRIGEDELDEAERRAPSFHENDPRHTIYETHIELDLPDFEDLDAEGEPTGVALPYIVTLDEGTRDVLAIRRNWKAGDPLKLKRLWFVHYKYLPGMGFYGWGLLHAIGALAEAATGALRALLDSAAFASMQGGLKSKDSKVKGGEIVLEPGKYKDIDLSAEELAKAFYTPPFKEPSSALFQLLGFLDEAGRRFASVTETLTGDAANTGPVGTTVALIEQGSMVFSAIHKRCHKAAGDEFQLIATLNAESLQTEYPYEVAGGRRLIFKADYDDRVDVIPVSDPNIFSSTQRIAIAQATLQLATEAPDLFDRREAYMRMLHALRVAEPEKVLPPPLAPPPRDPVSENAFLMKGKPIRAFAFQNHKAHMAVHRQFLMWLAANPGAQGGEEAMAPILNQMTAHLAEHLAYDYLVAMQRAMGVELPPVELNDDGEEPAPPLPPEIENQIALLAAAASDELMADVIPAGPSPEQLAAEAERAGAEEERRIRGEGAAADIARRDAAAAADIERRDRAAEADIRRKDKLAEARTEA
jgi:hypothetical protein